MITTPNVLFYTINDGHQDYLDCIEVLNTCLNKHFNSINFKIYTAISGVSKRRRGFRS
jgi:hypothetical protein